MNKRGETTVLGEIVKAIPAMMIVLLLVWAGVRLWNMTHPEQFTTEKKDLRRIASEIKDLKNNDDINVPTFSTSYNAAELVKINKENKDVYPGCSKDFCVCFDKLDSTMNKYVPFVCEPFDIDMKVFSYAAGECKEVNVIKGESKDNQIRLTRTGIGTCNIKLDYPMPKPQTSQNVAVSASSEDPNLATSEMGVSNNE